MSPKLRLLTAITLAMGMIIALLGLMISHQPPSVQAAAPPQTQTGKPLPSGNKTEQPLSSTQTIATNVQGAKAIAIADIDLDGDLDTIGIAQTSGHILWWENANADGSSWISHTVASGINNLADLAAADIDRDGDTDVTAVSSSGDSLLWWENSASDGTAWTVYTMSTSLNGAASIHTADIDRNGATDLLVTAKNDNDIIWYQNPLTVTREMT